MMRIVFGVLNDSETGDPVSFATVRFKGTSQGLIADYNGEFRIPESFKTPNTILIISSIGYQTQEIDIAKLDLYSLNRIQLIPQIEALDAVVVEANTRPRMRSIEANMFVKRSRGFTAVQLIRRAINNIPINLSKDSHSYIGYYREYQIVEDRFHNLHEFIVETFDPGIETNFLESDQAQTAVYSINRNPFYIQDMALLSEYDGNMKFITGAKLDGRGGNEYKILHTHNPIRSFDVNTFAFVYTLQRDFINRHNLRRAGITYIDNEPLAIITFDKAKSYVEFAYGAERGEAATRVNNPIEGKVLISLKDFSIHQFNYRYALHKSELFNVSIEYARREDGKMYLNYISFNNEFAVADNLEFREQKVIYDQGDQAFHVIFNNTVKPESLDANDFRFKMGGKRLKTVSAEMIENSVLGVRVKVVNWDNSPLEVYENDLEKIKYKLKNIFDVTGREIYDRNIIRGHQFRELFVQEVHTNKALPTDLRFMPKNKPAVGAPLNPGFSVEKYIVNSPLQQKKYRNESD
jgi:hypothetical protein